MLVARTNRPSGSSTVFAVLLVLSLSATGCGERAKGRCGNGVIDRNEQCDATDLAGATCESLGFRSGTLACSPDCTLDTSSCTGGRCGDAVINGDEQCDGTDLAQETCETLGYLGGSLACIPADCMFDLSGCTGGNCGNGIREADEQCDTLDVAGTTCVDLGFYSGTLACDKTCAFDTAGCFEAPTIPVGEPCTTNEDCTGGRCWFELQPWQTEMRYFVPFGYPGGYCTEYCRPNENCPRSAAIAYCLRFSDDSHWCLRRCDPHAATPECRPGYKCFELSDGTGRGVCYTECDDDSQCPHTGDCETDEESQYHGWCMRGFEDCTNGLDDDFDGRTDCADLECIGHDACPRGERCDTAADDDGDGAAGCMDAECALRSLCTGEVCSVAPGAELTCGTVLIGERNDAPGSTDVVENACLGGYTGGNEAEYTYRLTVAAPQLVTISLTGFQNDLDLIVVRQTVDATCDTGLGCFAASGYGPDHDEGVSFTAFPSVDYYVIVEGWGGTVSNYDIAVTCSATQFEDCANTTDDDGDGLADCMDPDCQGLADCTPEPSCVNGLDLDRDGSTDCLDNDCSAHAACQPGRGYWELWERGGANEVDLAFTTITFTRDASHPRGYTYTVTSNATAFPTVPGTGNATSFPLPITDDATALIPLPMPLFLHETGYWGFTVSDDGYVVFTNGGGRHPGPLGWNLYDRPRIAPLWADYDPALGGTIILDAFMDRLAITWDGLINKYSGLSANRFQLVFFLNGDIQMTWLDVDAVANLSHTTAGYVTLLGDNQGLPPSETDLVP